MVDPKYVDAGLTSEELAPLVSSCIASLGKREFFADFLTLLHCGLEADQSMVFSYGSKKDVQCLISNNHLNPTRGRSLARLYIEGAYRNDPVFHAAQNMEPGTFRIFYLGDIRASMAPDYLNQFFTSVELTDKVAFVLVDSEHIFCTSLYRLESTPSFKNNNCGIDSGMGLVAAQLINRHYDISPQFKGEGPLAMLSQREREVCQEILRGKKSEAIAALIGVSVNTVGTYKKRAYEKLGIHSRAALFSLCS